MPRRPEETFALDVKIASARIIDYKLLVSLPLSSPPVTHANDGAARGLRCSERPAPDSPDSPLTHRYTEDLGNERREKASGCRYREEQGRGANCREFTFYCARPRQTAGFFSRALGSLFVSYLRRRRPTRTRARRAVLSFEPRENGPRSSGRRSL